MYKTYKQILVAAGWLAAAAPAAAVDPAALLASQCAGCHGRNGASVGDLMPIIGGLNAHYLETALREYQSSARDSTIMGRIASGYTPAQIKAMAAYLAAQRWVSAPVRVDPQLAAKGQAIHEDQCDTCHPDGGRAQEKDAPRLAGQWPDFTLVYLEQCRAKGADCEPRRMGSRVKRLSDADLKSLAQYYAGQR